MSELADRLRRAIEAHEVNGELAGFVADAAAELDRLGELLGPAAYQTDARWADHMIEAGKKLDTVLDAAVAGRGKQQAQFALSEARFYWETHLALTEAGPGVVVWRGRL